MLLLPAVPATSPWLCWHRCATGQQASSRELRSKNYPVKERLLILAGFIFWSTSVVWMVVPAREGAERGWEDGVRMGRVGTAWSVPLAEEHLWNRNETGSVTTGKFMSTVWPVMNHHPLCYCVSFRTDHTLISGHQLSPLSPLCAQVSVGIAPGRGPEVSHMRPVAYIKQTTKKDCFTNATSWFYLFHKMSARKPQF